MVKYPFNGWMRLFHHVPILKSQCNAIISKKNLKEIKYHLFHEGTKRVVIEASINCPKKVTLLLAHLSLYQKSRKKQIEELINIVNSIKNPVILMGDFNTFQGECEIRMLLEKTHLSDHSSLDSYSLKMTQPTWHPKRRLDYILVSNKIKVKEYRVLNYPFSDHMPLYLEFRVQ
jgi:endonuclease/exonuclease/phosphatase family metal-dependent hydrolase